MGIYTCFFVIKKKKTNIIFSFTIGNYKIPTIKYRSMLNTMSNLCVNAKISILA